MADYLTHDLTLDLGNALPEDTTLNMLQFRERRTTLVIARSTLPDKQTFEDAYRLQIDLLRKRLGTLSCTDPQPALIGQDQAIEGTEMAIQFMRGDAPVYQLQLACQVPGQPRMLVLNYSKPSAFTEVDVDHWRTIKRSLRFNG